MKIFGDMAEVGVFRDFGACLMACYLRESERLALVDIMYGLDYSVEAIKEVAGSDVVKRITFHQSDSMRLRYSELLSPRSEVRFFHIDGEHSYDGAMNDLLLAAQNISPHGIAVVDDFFSEASPAIPHATFNFAGQTDNNLSIFLIGYNKAYLCTNRWLGFYREVIQSLPDELEKRGYLCQLAAGGFAFERTYMRISNRATENRYQLIGKFIPDADTVMSATNRY